MNWQAPKVCWLPPAFVACLECSRDGLERITARDAPAVGFLPITLERPLKMRASERRKSSAEQKKDYFIRFTQSPSCIL
jgi:hypothetical protein